MSGSRDENDPQEEVERRSRMRILLFAGYKPANVFLMMS